MATQTLTELRPESQLLDWLDLLKANGFNRSELGPGGDTVSVACSQCVARVINGVAVHEHGCPNEPGGVASLTSYIVREERWEKGRQRMGFMVVQIPGSGPYLEVFRQTGRKRTRVRKCRLAVGDRDGGYPCQTVAAGFHAAGFKPQMVWVNGEQYGSPASVFYAMEPTNDYTAPGD